MTLKPFLKQPVHSF